MIHSDLRQLKFELTSPCAILMVSDVREKFPPHCLSWGQTPRYSKLCECFFELLFEPLWRIVLNTVDIALFYVYGYNVTIVRIAVNKSEVLKEMKVLSDFGQSLVKLKRITSSATS